MALPIRKYMSFAKFSYILEHGTLFFPQVSSMEDKSEGLAHSNPKEARRSPKSAIRSSKKVLKADGSVVRQTKMSWAVIDEQIRKDRICISSWNSWKYESSLLWSAYAPGNEAVCLVTTEDRLRQSLREEKDPAKQPVFGKVNYKYQNDNTLPTAARAFFKKHRAFQHEGEYRVLINIHQRDFKNSAIGNHLKSADTELRRFNGLYVKVDLKQLVESVIITPKASVWFKDLVTSAIKNKGLCIKPVDSELSDSY